MQLSLALIFIFVVIEFFLAAFVAEGVYFTNAARDSNAFSHSVFFRIHEGVNIVSDFLLKDGDSASCNSGERTPFEELCNVWSILSK